MWAAWTCQVPPPPGGAMASWYCRATSTVPNSRRLRRTSPPPIPAPRSTARSLASAQPGLHRRWVRRDHCLPVPAPALCRVVVHDKLVALVEAVFGTEDIRIYAAELRAKHSGAPGYEQEHHRDDLNHTPLVPSASDLRWRGLEMFILPSDAPEVTGRPTSCRRPSPLEGLPGRTAASAPSGRTSMSTNNPGQARPWPTAPTPSTGHPDHRPESGIRVECPGAASW